MTIFQGLLIVLLMVCVSPLFIGICTICLAYLKDRGYKGVLDFFKRRKKTEEVIPPIFDTYKLKIRTKDGIIRYYEVNQQEYKRVYQEFICSDISEIFITTDSIADKPNSGVIWQIHKRDIESLEGILLDNVAIVADSWQLYLSCKTKNYLGVYIFIGICLFQTIFTIVCFDQELRINGHNIALALQSGSKLFVGTSICTFLVIVLMITLYFCKCAMNLSRRNNQSISYELKNNFWFNLFISVMCLFGTMPLVHYYTLSIYTNYFLS